MHPDVICIQIQYINKIAAKYQKMMKQEEHKYTKYEIARIIGARALQISMNAPMLLVIPKEKMEEINYDPIKIAELEFKSGILPITIKRPLPRREASAKEDEEAEIVKREEVIPGEEKIEKETEEELEETTEEEEPAPGEEAIEETD